MSKVKNFNKWFTEDIQEWLTWYKQVPDGDISTRFRLRYDNIEVYVRLPREQHYSWISLKSLCSTLDWRIEMEPGDIERLRDFITAEAKPLLDARAAELAKRQQQREQAKQTAQDAAAYVAELEDQHVKLVELCARLTGDVNRLAALNRTLLHELGKGWTDYAEYFQPRPLPPCFEIEDNEPSDEEGDDC